MNVEWFPSDPTELPDPAVRQVVQRSASATPSQHYRDLGVSTWLVTGRLVSLQFIRAALRRHRKFWVATAVVGLLVGLGYHAVVPLKYSATSTVYLVHPATAGATIGAQNDLALLDTTAVAKKAITILKDPSLSAGALLGKDPGTLVSDNLLDVTTSGPSPQAAVQRVDALVKAFLAFRAQQYASENRKVVASERHQLTELQSELSTLAAQKASTTTLEAASALTDKQSAITADITSLQNAIQQSALDTLAVSEGSRVITPGTPIAVSKKKVLGLDGLTGLVGGLGGGLIIVAVGAVVADRPRRREDVASLLGAPVDVSVPPSHRPRFLRPSMRKLATSRNSDIQRFASHLGKHLIGGHPSVVLVVAIDELVTPGAALLALSNSQASTGKRVALVDATASRSLGRQFGKRGAGLWPLDDAVHAVHLIVPPLPGEQTEGAPVTGLDTLSGFDVALVLASVEPAVGADHLYSWSEEAVVALTAGESSVQRIGGTGELLSAAGIGITSVVLLGVDERDESVGLPIFWAARHGSGASAQWRRTTSTPVP